MICEKINKYIYKVFFFDQFKISENFTSQGFTVLSFDIAPFKIRYVKKEKKKKNY